MRKKTAKKSAKITTIEGLAAAMAEGFADVHVEISDFRKEVNLRFDALEKRLEEAEQRIAALEMKVAGLYRLLEEDKMQKLDVTHLFMRLEQLEVKVFGKKQ